MARTDGGELLTRTLARHGVREGCTLHGPHLHPASQAESARRLRFIDTRHEQAAGHAADGWARTTARVGVAMVTAGPGVTDVVTAVANAYLDCIPTLFIGGAAPLRDAETLPLQGGFDQLALMQPITKWAHRITQTARIPDLVTQALRVATTGRPGPVFLEVPIDVLFARVDEERASVPAYLRPEAAPAPAAAAVERALAWLAEAERPVIMAGGGVWFSGGAAELRAFAELTGIPVVANSKAQGIVPGDHPLAGGGFGTLAAAGPEAVIVADGGETASWMEMAARVGAGGRWLSHGYLGCLGTGMPFALAAKVAHPDRPVVCVVGDGSVGLNFAEFDTMVRHGLAIVTVVNNDAQWGMSAHGQDLIFGEGRRVVTDLVPTRYDLAAAGFGCHAEHVEAPADLRPALRRALAAGRPACVDVRTDPRVVSPLTIAMVGAAAPADAKAPERVQMPYYRPLGEQ